VKRRAVLLFVGFAYVLAACEREERSYRSDPIADETSNPVALSTLSPGEDKQPAKESIKGKQYEQNAYQLSQGKRLFSWFNCNGCHANGGGGMGPALMDDKWIYGGEIDNIVATIRDGRPNGMPSFRDKIPEDQIWQIAAFVRSLGGNVPSDAAPSRNDSMNAHPAENRLSPTESQPSSTSKQ
jgi:cytochrome c oxidase cbb3-type subunit 3